MSLYKNSLLTNYKDRYKLDVNLRTVVDNKRRIYEIQEPSYFNINDLGSTAKFFLQGASLTNKLLFKDVNVFKKDISTLSGKTIKIMSLGDSLTEGLEWRNTPVTMLTSRLEECGVNVTMIGTLVRNDFIDPATGQNRQVKYEGRGGWRYRSIVGLESRYAYTNQEIPESQTKSEWVVGIDGENMNAIKKYNPWLYPATAEDKATYPDFCFHFVYGSQTYNKSYSEDQSLEDYVIFDPIRYFTLRQVTIPDVLTIAFGTNEWYIPTYGGFDLEKATSCARFLITRFRQALPNTDIVVIPLNNFPVSRESDWEQYAMPLCDSVTRVCEDLITAGDNHLFVAPIYCQGSKALGYNGTKGSASYVGNNHSLKQIDIDTNVHMLYVADDSNDDYSDALFACVANLIS